MTFFRMHCGVVQRSRGGSAVRRSAYQACRALRTADGRVYDYSDRLIRNGHVCTMMLAPDGSPDWADDVTVFWARASAFERRGDAQEARTVEVALPHQLPQHLWEPCVRTIAMFFLQFGMVVQADIHAPWATTGVRNVHVHFLLSLRCIEGESFGLKAREWNRMFRAIRPLRAQVATILSGFCRSHGIDFIADARSNHVRGLPEPEPILPRWHFIAERRTGMRSLDLRQRDEHRAVRDQLAGLEAELVDLDNLICVEAAGLDAGGEPWLAEASRAELADQPAAPCRHRFPDPATRLPDLPAVEADPEDAFAPRRI